MKRDWILKILFLALFIVSGSILFPRKTKMLTADQALRIVETTAEAKALLKYNQGTLADCLKRTIVKTCASDYVTCRDNAWVIQYELTSFCPVQSDGRLGLNVLIDGLTAQIVSRYPEVEYFQNAQYCKDNADCLKVQDQCVNFVAAPFLQTAVGVRGSCECRQNRCEIALTFKGNRL